MASNHKIYPDDTVQVFVPGKKSPIELSHNTLVGLVEHWVLDQEWIKAQAERPAATKGKKNAK